MFYFPPIILLFCSIPQLEQYFSMRSVAGITLLLYLDPGKRVFRIHHNRETFVPQIKTT